MPKRSLSDQLDGLLDAMLAGPAGELPPPAPDFDPRLGALLAIARELRDLPREGFKSRLKSELERKTSMASRAEALAPVRQTATPRLRIRNAAAAIEFYKKAFGAREIMRFVGHGQIGHAELEIGNSIVMLGEEAPEYGFPGPNELGGSPVSIHLYVDDADALVAQAAAAGARVLSPVKDQFYGDRGGSVADPFGYTWDIATRKETLSVEEMYRRFEETEGSAPAAGPEGVRTVTPYIVAQDAPGLIDFVKRVFGAEEKLRSTGSAGGIHCEVRIGDSTLMIGGGGPKVSWRGESWPTVLHIYVPDTDAAYQRALEAGAESIGAPADQSYGERSGGVKDPAGNQWYIATHKGDAYVPQGAATVMPYLHPLRAEPVITFLKRAFGAEEVGKYASPDGVIHHAQVRIGESMLEMGEAHGPYQPVRTMFNLSVSNVDAAHLRAVRAGATSIQEPADQPYGARTAAVQDVFGNQWYMAAARVTPRR